MNRVLYALLATGLLALQSITAVTAQEPQTAQSVMANVANTARAPRTFQAATSLQLKQRSFPWKKVALNGTSYFEAPNHLTVRFANIPGYMSGLPRAYANVLNVGAWPSEYNAVLGAPRTVNGHRDLVLQLTPKDAGSSDRGTAFVNPTDWTIEEVAWDLSGGIQLNMSEGYALIGAYRVPANQALSIHTPYATADGNATLQNYAMNVPINHQIFTQQ